MNKFTEYIKENSEQILLRLKEICEDSIQEIVDNLKLDNLESIQDSTNSWIEYWENKNGWYNIECCINDKKYYKPVVEISIEFRISKKMGVLAKTELNGLLHRLDMIGFISNVSTHL